MELGPVGTPATMGLLCQPRMRDERGTVGGMRIGRWNRSTRRKSTPETLSPSQTQKHLSWDRTWVFAVDGSVVSMKLIWLALCSSLDLRGMKWQEAGEKCIMRSFTICTARLLLGYSNQEIWGEQSVQHAWQKCMQSSDWKIWKKET
jgi:hypothetical protein